MDKTFEIPNLDAGTSELMGELSDALEILYSCRRLDVAVPNNFLDHIDELMNQIEARRGFTPMGVRASVDSWPTLMAEA